ncbi:polysaccharide deacetylase family protein [Planomonospora sp. ID67723]|uniref:polysaccharide deacetylase family protein n=1 Tax=Planomonospora sp. ID67723 TaxID=2738134 RepID=UPI0018C4442C|nr:polysaccharide deacetylase family protein [Planomonospora sp. ID67723]MBG0832548.1 polysaccharide deacetylase family protein [Planomonospora sp. ID67723]
MRLHALSLITALTALVASGGPAHADGPTGEIVHRTQNAGQVVALTFDDGPSPTWTPEFLELLRREQVRATFCLLGSQARAHPELVRRIVADGHAVCNHTLKHDYIAGWTPQEIHTELTATNEAIRTAAGDPGLPIRYFRAPYAGWGASPQVAASLGMTALAWTTDPQDWDGSPADVLAQRLDARRRPTAVVLSHDGGGDRSATLAAYRQVLPRWRQDGWGFDRPAVTGGPYPVVCTAPAWRVHDVYGGGDRVSRDGRVYQARWWTKLEDPLAAPWVWADLGAC